MLAGVYRRQGASACAASQQWDPDSTSKDGICAEETKTCAAILRMIESTAKNGVPVLATTNRREALDAAILRKGRFDHSRMSITNNIPK
jgi:hypothetical protein